ncbi:6-hydroxynicotinate 3-monooxygenase [Fusarium austroafricanum]|uniref:6-hydroxynicotinate 3-monooxygenase n=1 Tax=Fusarium austroafricanum TaxID=2364996 RepID=A0A8H4KHZ0_9HYPO|nr:6-hydroxynicotinate 3-monooxygenase [Fusarium austroafricanum]
MESFKVIVVGAGPVGMVLAHALQVSGIDFVLVEQRSQIAPEPAYGLFLWPHIMRIFHQLGLLEAVKAVAQPMVEAIHMSLDGNEIHRSRGFEQLQTLYGYPMAIFNRADFAGALLGALKNKEKHIKLNKRLTNVQTHENGIRAEFTDGTWEDGSIIVGADGIWSSVRDQMKAKAPKGLFDPSINPFSASHAGVYAKVLIPKELEHGRNINVYQKDAHVQVFTGLREAQIIVYHRIPTAKERTYFAQNDAEEAAQPWLDVPVGKGVTFGDLWRNKIAGGSANFDEGVLPWWHWSRMVLVGDAAHKMNPMRGAGACVGMEDAIALVNGLHRLLRSEPNPSQRELQTVFGAYQYERESPAKLWMDISALNLELCIGANQPALKAQRVADIRTLPLVADGPILQHIPFPNEMNGMIPWTKKARKSASDDKVKAHL